MDALTLAPPALVLGAIVPTALLGRWAARRLGQPEVVGEISVCLLLGVLLVTRFGWGGAHSPGKDVLAELGHLGLALFLVGAAHEIRGGASRLSGRAVAWLTVGSALLPMAAGALLAAWVLRYGGPRLRGGADTPALVLLLIVSLAVTAVPVLAGILKDRRMQHTETGRLAMASAVTIDAVTWVLLRCPWRWPPATAASIGPVPSSPAARSAPTRCAGWPPPPRCGPRPPPTPRRYWSWSPRRPSARPPPPANSA
ncbi:cation:proton antiporter [Streptomyces noursei]|nr:cation:proton antiporter [Streptomyces noursei]